MDRIAAGLLVALTITGCQPSDGPPADGAGNNAAVYGAAAGNVRAGQVTAHLEQLLWDQRAPAYIQSDIWHLVRTSYDRRQYRPYWVGAGAPGRAATLVGAVCRAEEEGLRSRHYQIGRLESELAALRRFRSADRLGELDLLLTGVLFAYGEDLLLGRVEPGAVAPEWNAAPPRAAAEQLLQQALAGDASLDSALAALRPQSAAYGGLIEELARLRAAGDVGGWAEIPMDSALRRGSEGGAVDAMRRRLAATGELAAADTTPGRAFDRALGRAVARFQERHGLESDGVAGLETIAAMNVPVEHRIAQVEANLERYRWIPENLLSRYALLEVPARRLTAVDGTVVAQMEAWLGGEARAAIPPMLADTINRVVLHPWWTVPPGVVSGTLVPLARRDRSFAARAGLTVFRRSDGTSIPADSIRWMLDSLAGDSYLVRQRPGPRNVLGPVLMTLRNSEGVYIHGASPDADSRLKVAGYEGSIIVERPLDLASIAAPTIALSTLRAAVEAAAATTAEFDAALPIFVLAPTAYRDTETMRFSPDVPERDRAIAEALGPADPMGADRCEELALSAASAVLSAP